MQTGGAAIRPALRMDQIDPILPLVRIEKFKMQFQSAPAEQYCRRGLPAFTFSAHGTCPRAEIRSFRSRLRCQPAPQGDVLADDLHRGGAFEVEVGDRHVAVRAFDGLDVDALVAQGVDPRPVTVVVDAVDVDLLKQGVVHILRAGVDEADV